MSYQDDYAVDVFAADAALAERATFIRRTYLHVGAAILAFIGMETAIFSTPALLHGILGLVGAHWWIAILAFIVVGWIAQYWAHNAPTAAAQYLGLALYTVAETIIFVPLLWIANQVGGPDSHIIGTAALLTMIIFGGLTAVVFVTKADFSFLRMGLVLATLGAFGVSIAGAIFGFGFPLFMTAAMVAVAAGWILYDTSNILHHYRTDQHVGAALELFASVALLFWDILWLLIRLQGDD